MIWRRNARSRRSRGDFSAVFSGQILVIGSIGCHRDSWGIIPQRTLKKPDFCDINITGYSMWQHSLDSIHINTQLYTWVMVEVYIYTYIILLYILLYILYYIYIYILYILYIIWRNQPQISFLNGWFFGATFSRWGLAPSLSEPGGAWWSIREAKTTLWLCQNSYWKWP